jgi:hypothetical protein
MDYAKCINCRKLSMNVQSERLDISCCIADIAIRMTVKEAARNNDAISISFQLGMFHALQDNL